LGASPILLAAVWRVDGDATRLPNTTWRKS